LWKCQEQKEVNLTEKEIQPGIWVMEMSGNVHMGADCKRVDQDVEAHIQKQHMRIIFDLGKVHHIDSAFVGQIVKSFSRMKKAGGKLRLAAVTGMAEGVLKMTQVDKVVPIFPTVTAACEDFSE
jgi:anti-sigma B factor antagonist